MEPTNEELQESGEKIAAAAQAIFAALRDGDFSLPVGITGQAYALGKSLEMFSQIAGPAMGQMLTNKVLAAIAWNTKQSAPSVH